jgi:hypothetical protein
MKYIPERGTLVMWTRDDISAMTKGKTYTVGGRYYDDYSTPSGRYYRVGRPIICIEQCDEGHPSGYYAADFELASGPW